MGAWGHGYFEDDSALDFMADLEGSDDPKEFIKDAFDTALRSDYADSDEGNAVIVSATYIDRQVNGTKFSSGEQMDPLEVDTFYDRRPDIDLSDLREKAILALNRILADRSELKELWEENEEDFPTWKQGVQQLIQRIKK